MIMHSVSPDMRIKIQRMENVHAQLQYLKHFEPSMVEWKSVLQDRLSRLCNPDPHFDLIAWVDTWISLGQDALEAQVTSINAVTLPDTFLHCAARLDYAYAVANNHIPEADSSGQEHTLHSVIRSWHLLRRQLEPFS